MDIWFQIWCAQSGNNIHTFKPNGRLYWLKRITQWCKLQVHMLIVAKKWKKEITLSIEVVFRFEYATFVGDSMHSATSTSWIFYTQGVDMDSWF
jgi:hypothetical protein